MIRSVDIGLEGMFNISLDAPQWRPFTSNQRVIVLDAYVAGMRVLKPALFGVSRWALFRARARSLGVN